MKGTTDLRLLQSSLRLAGSVVALLGEAPDAGQLPRQLLVFSDLLLEAPGGHEHYSFMPSPSTTWALSGLTETCLKDNLSS